MLEILKIKNFGLIDNLEIEFSKGLTVMTGETGAGKTMIVEALNFICGERTKQEFIRTGADFLQVEAIFSIDKNIKIKNILEQFNLKSDEESLIIRRELNSLNKNKCVINGSQITLSILKQIGDALVDIHGQHEHQSLLFSENHLILLDNFAQINSNVQIVKKLYTTYKNIQEKIQKFELEKKERTNKIDFLGFQIQEIDLLNLKQGEEEELGHKSTLLRNAEKFARSTEKIYTLLYEGQDAPTLLEILNKIIQELKELAIFDETLKQSLQICENTDLELKEVSVVIKKFQDSIEFDPNMQLIIEERLSNIQKLKRKYGNSISEILDYRDKIQKKVENLKNQEENFDVCKQNLLNTKNELTKKVISLSLCREENAKILKNNIEKELKDLGLLKTEFVIKIQKIEDLSGDILIDNKTYFLFPWGIDKIEFFISTNPGEEPKPLEKVASGGEISRIMLALKTIDTKEGCVPTVVFDEIDVGVGGAQASKIGKKLQNISNNFQVMCITHLPQIASLADNHFFISKKVKEDRTITEIEKLDSKSRVKEIARMLAGEKITDLTLKHAEEFFKK